MSDTVIVCADLNAAIDDWRAKGFRLDVIYPADEPHSAVVSRGRESIRLTSKPDAAQPSTELPPFMPEFVLTRGGSPGEGRAGMQYRDLVPGRLGGRYIASHITIPAGGPVADWVHFHQVAVQMIYVAKGWARVVYEDQGEPFVIKPGDLLLQPPQIRHRVLESAPGLEVIEISTPALHATLADHEMELPNGRIDPGRLFGDQRFFHGDESRQPAIGEASAGLAQVRTVRRGEAPSIHFPPHAGELVFGFVLDGSAELDFSGSQKLGRGDALVIPPREEWRLEHVSADFRMLHVTTARMG